MSAFTRGPIVTPHPKSDRKWVLIDPFSYDVGEEDSGIRITVPRRYVTDFASVPRFLWPLIDPYGRPGWAAIIHDWLYYVHRWPPRGIQSWPDFSEPMSRREADEVFLEAMAVLGVGWFKRRAMHLAVRLFGRGAWDRKREEVFYHGTI